MKNQQREQALTNLDYFFDDENSDFVQLNHAIHATENKTVKCLLIMNALDMLAQYYVGEIKNNRTAKRFINLLIECGNCTSKEAEILFQFRNALCHHFGTFSYNHLANKKYHFKINTQENSLIEEQNYQVKISVNHLENLFQKVLSNIKNKFLNNEKRLMNFNKIYKFVNIVNKK